MNVYDEAHNLARAIKESNEYIETARFVKRSRRILIFHR